MLKNKNSVDTSSKILNSIDTWKKTIYPKSDGQKKYIQAINEYDVYLAWDLQVLVSPI